MKPVITVAAALAGLLAAAPALAASCTERITALEARLDKAADTAISTSSGGQGVAGAREGQAIHADRSDAPVGTPAVPFQHEAKEAGVVERSAEQAGGGGDRIMQAKASLNQAKSFDQQGNTAACDEAVAEAQKQLDPQ
jgi:hypothetical protein